MPPEETLERNSENMEGESAEARVSAERKKTEDKLKQDAEDEQKGKEAELKKKIEAAGDKKDLKTLGALSREAHDNRHEELEKRSKELSDEIEKANAKEEDEKKIREKQVEKEAIDDELNKDKKIEGNDEAERKIKINNIVEDRTKEVDTEFDKYDARMKKALEERDLEQDTISRKVMEFERLLNEREEHKFEGKHVEHDDFRIWHQAKEIMDIQGDVQKDVLGYYNDMQQRGRELYAAIADNFDIKTLSDYNYKQIQFEANLRIEDHVKNRYDNFAGGVGKLWRDMKVNWFSRIEDLRGKWPDAEVDDFQKQVVDNHNDDAEINAWHQANSDQTKTNKTTEQVIEGGIAENVSEIDHLVEKLDGSVKDNVRETPSRNEKILMAERNLAAITSKVSQLEVIAQSAETAADFASVERRATELNREIGGTYLTGLTRIENLLGEDKESLQHAQDMTGDLSARVKVVENQIGKLMANLREPGNPEKIGVLVATLNSARQAHDKIEAALASSGISESDLWRYQGIEMKAQNEAGWEDMSVYVQALDAGKVASALQEEQSQLQQASPERAAQIDGILQDLAGIETLKTQMEQGKTTTEHSTNAVLLEDDQADAAQGGAESVTMDPETVDASAVLDGEIAKETKVEEPMAKQVEEVIETEAEIVPEVPAELIPPAVETVSVVQADTVEIPETKTEDKIKELDEREAQIEKFFQMRAEPTSGQNKVEEAVAGEAPQIFVTEQAMAEVTAEEVKPETAVEAAEEQETKSKAAESAAPVEPVEAVTERTPEQIQAAELAEAEANNIETEALDGIKPQAVGVEEQMTDVAADKVEATKSELTPEATQAAELAAAAEAIKIDEAVSEAELEPVKPGNLEKDKQAVKNGETDKIDDVEEAETKPNDGQDLSPEQAEPKPEIIEAKTVPVEDETVDAREATKVAEDLDNKTAVEMTAQNEKVETSVVIPDTETVKADAETNAKTNAEPNADETATVKQTELTVEPQGEALEPVFAEKPPEDVAAELKLEQKAETLAEVDVKTIPDQNEVIAEEIPEALKGQIAGQDGLEQSTTEFVPIAAQGIVEGEPVPATQLLEQTQTAHNDTPLDQPVEGALDATQITTAEQPLTADGVKPESEPEHNLIDEQTAASEAPLAGASPILDTSQTPATELAAEVPVETPVEAQVEIPVEAPVETPVEAQVEPQAEPQAEPMIEPVPEVVVEETTQITEEATSNEVEAQSEASKAAEETEALAEPLAPEIQPEVVELEPETQADLVASEFNERIDKLQAELETQENNEKEENDKEDVEKVATNLKELAEQENKTEVMLEEELRTQKAMAGLGKALGFEHIEGPQAEIEQVDGEAVLVEPKDEIPTEIVEPESAETEPVMPEPVETEPVETEPVETEPVETEPVETKHDITEDVVIEDEALHQLQKETEQQVEEQLEEQRVAEELIEKEEAEEVDDEAAKAEQEREEADEKAVIAKKSHDAEEALLAELELEAELQRLQVAEIQTAEEMSDEEIEEANLMNSLREIQLAKTELTHYRRTQENDLEIVFEPAIKDLPRKKELLEKVKDDPRLMDLIKTCPNHCERGCQDFPCRWILETMDDEYVRDRIFGWYESKKAAEQTQEQFMAQYEKSLSKIETLIRDPGSREKLMKYLVEMLRALGYSNPEAQAQQMLENAGQLRRFMQAKYQQIQQLYPKLPQFLQ